MIKCETFSNSKCVKCGKVKSAMVHAGAINMCCECFVEEFGFIAEIEPDSPDGRKYYKWLEKAIVE